MPDKTIKCRDCGTSFKFTEKDQEYYKEKGYENEPQRCPDCRKARKNQSNEDNRGGNRRTTNGNRRTINREMFPAVCDECGSKTTVPFQPISGKPVYCSDCYRRMRNQNNMKALKLK